MEERVLQYIAEHPRTRLRYILSDLRTTRNILIPLLSKLEKENKVRAVAYRDMANMEFYNMWEIV